MRLERRAARVERPANGRLVATDGGQAAFLYCALLYCALPRTPIARVEPTWCVVTSKPTVTKRNAIRVCSMCAYQVMRSRRPVVGSTTRAETDFVCGLLVSTSQSQSCDGAVVQCTARMNTPTNTTKGGACVWMCVCLCVCACVYVSVCLCVYACASVRLRLCVCVTARD